MVWGAKGHRKQSKSKKQKKAKKKNYVMNKFKVSY